ncbi:MAG: hypothetical protein HYR71_06595 [Chloroflexi bacterium]|nr:hypothetical protein [Chloroflexota bacterium]
MTTRAAAAPSPHPEPVEGSPGFFTQAYLRFRRDSVSVAALAVFALIGLTSLAAPLIAAQVLHTDPTRQDLLRDYEPPSAQHWGGTDAFGRDALTRVLYAGQVSLGIGLAVVLVQLTIGVPLGLIAGYSLGAGAGLRSAQLDGGDAAGAGTGALGETARLH